MLFEPCLPASLLVVSCVGSVRQHTAMLSNVCACVIAIFTLPKTEIQLHDDYLYRTTHTVHAICFWNSTYDLLYQAILVSHTI